MKYLIYFSRQNEDIINKIDNISYFLNKEKEDKLSKNNLLRYDVQKTNNSIENLSSFSDIIKNLSSENSKLKTENHKLIHENGELKKKLSQYQIQTYTNNSRYEF